MFLRILRNIVFQNNYELRFLSLPLIGRAGGAACEWHP